jgi:long-chain fatty acid transport protein
MSVRRRASLALLAGVFASGVPAVAHATGVTEYPDNGSEQGMRGGAWVARASDPLAAFYNPAGLAGQPTRLVFQANMPFQSTCFARQKAMNDQTQDGVAMGQAYPKVCASNGMGIVPQLAMTFRVTDRIGIGFAPLLTPSGGASNIQWPQFVSTVSPTTGKVVYEPGPTRYLLTDADLIVITPTLGIGVEVVDRLRLGVSFEWGVASLSFTNAIAATANASPGAYSTASDIQSVAKVHDYFIPGLTAGAIYSPSNSFDIAGWYKWSNPISAEGDVVTTGSYYNGQVAQGKSPGGSVTNTALSNCGIAGTPAGTCGPNDLKLTVQQPMEAKVGFRYHMPRKDLPYDEHVRDPIAQDVFDIEADFTWANDSAFQALEARLPSNMNIGTLPVAVTPMLTQAAPSTADVPHNYHDVFGVRLGGDVNVIPDRWAIRGGGFFQSSALNAQYQNIDFPASTNFGLSIGTTYRLHLSKEKANALELSLGYAHIFYLDETYNGPGGIPATAGTPCLSPASQVGGSLQCSNGSTIYRTQWAVNLGTITNSINVLNVGLGYKF